MGLVLVGFYVVAGGQADRLVLCLLGFVIARMIVTRMTKPRANRQALPTPGEGGSPCALALTSGSSGSTASSS